MTEQEMRTAIRDLFLGGDTSVEIPPDFNLISAGICDSFALLQLAMQIEQVEDIQIPDSDVTVDNFGTINAGLAYLASRKA